MYVLFAVSVFAMLVDIAIGLVLQQRLYSRLCAEHPNVMEILAESSAGIAAFQRYFWKRQYVGLEDGALTRQADFLRRYWKVCLLFFLLVTVAILVADIFET